MKITLAEVDLTSTKQVHFLRIVQTCKPLQLSVKKFNNVNISGYDFQILRTR